jgi:hypothetical protein
MVRWWDGLEYVCRFYTVDLLGFYKFHHSTFIELSEYEGLRGTQAEKTHKEFDTIIHLYSTSCGDL